MIARSKQNLLYSLDPPFLFRSQTQRYLAFTYRDQYVMPLEAATFCDLPYCDLEKIMAIDKLILDDVTALNNAK